MEKFRPEIIAHRGASFDAPENTRASVQLAGEQGADAVEIDVRLSRDGQIVVMHDANTLRTTGHDGLVSAQTLRELRGLDAGRWKSANFAGERIPTLADVIAALPDGKRLIIEVKAGPEMLPPLAQTLMQCGTPSAFCVISFDCSLLETLKPALPAVEMYWLVGSHPDPVTGALPPGVETLIARAQAASIQGVNVSHAATVDRAFVAKLHDAGLKCLVSKSELFAGR